jgi:hypothetical protein
MASNRSVEGRRADAARRVRWTAVDVARAYGHYVAAGTARVEVIELR